MSASATQPAATPDAGAPARHTQQRKRQDRIRERVVADGFVRIPELAEEFRVSVMTIHRDLETLERQGWLRRIRGGATAQPSALYHGDIRHRTATATTQKASIAAAAEQFVEPGQALVVDDSTTALQLVERLPALGPVTVITNFLSAVKILAGEPGIDLVCLGGEYYPAYDSFFGMQTVSTMTSLRGDTLFMSTTAITDGRCYHLSQETIQVKRALMAGVSRRILLVDHTKFSRNAVHELGRLSEFDVVIVDAEISEADLDMVRRAGPQVVVAETGTPADG
ncbi:DeoR family transcriptional regulator [Haloactinopolyspora alba]|uniref:DeoR family transcriptional regulator n=1 Tax=Haloactinopolyspora alba TaxID=648780 RepID=A0A2P8E7M2_9ACTN|nr:DeoR/GlpR family DNA-binding transcription regulator [Haloactinopolyspora alba]PSL05474.1 DeoR family transcriptional regulator [Haloactinopolyspora alba]